MENKTDNVGTMAITVTVTMDHIAKLSQLAEWLGWNKSAVVRRAIEAMYDAEAVRHTEVVA